MQNIPLHPMIVHFPIVLAVILPIAALAGFWFSRRGTVRGWTVPLALAVMLFVSAFAATRTGQMEEEKVERVASEQAIERHEEAAERFLVLSGVLVLITATGFLRGSLGLAARGTAAFASVLFVAAAFQVGRAGGELVYGENAGAAYQASSTDGNSPATDNERTNDKDGDD